MEPIYSENDRVEPSERSDGIPSFLSSDPIVSEAFFFAFASASMARSVSERPIQEDNGCEVEASDRGCATDTLDKLGRLVPFGDLDVSEEDTLGAVRVVS